MSVLAYFAVLRPLLKQRDTFTQQQQKLTTQRQKASQLTAFETAYRKQLESAQQALNDRRIKLSSADQVNNQVAKLAELVNECGLKADDVQLGRTLKGARYSTVAISLSGSGRYGKCIAFLRGLKEAFPDTGVASFKISADPRALKDPGKFQFGLHWYAAGKG